MRNRVAVVGMGKMGLLHASLLNVLPEVELVTACEQNPLVRRFCNKILKGIKVVGDVKELIGLNLNAIYVTTPISSHFLVIKMIYDEGIAYNIFVEKPLAASYLEAKQLSDLVSTKRGVNMVGYNRRFAVTFRKAKELLDKKALGEVISFEGYAYSSDFLGVKASSRALLKMGVLRDLGCHAIDLALWLFGDLSVETAESQAILSENSQDFVSFGVKALSGLTGKLKSSWCMQNYRLPEIGLKVKGSSGIMRVNDDVLELKLNDKEPLTWHRHNLGDNVSFFLGGAEYLREDEAFVMSLLSGHGVEPSFLTALRVNQIIEQAEEKAKG